MKVKFYCDVCDEYLCAECRENHDETHNIFDITENSSAMFRPWSDLKGWITKIKEKIEEKSDDIKDEDLKKF